MNKIAKTAFKCIISGVLFTICYLIISLIMRDKIDLYNILCTAAIYTVFLFLLSVIVPLFRKGNKSNTK